MRQFPSILATAPRSRPSTTTGRWIAFLLLALTCALWTASGRAEGVAWRESSLEQALVEAGQTGQRVLVELYTQWCGACLAMEAEVFPTPEASQAMAGLIPIRLDAEQGDGPAIVDRYHVVGYPTLLLLRPDGVEIDRIFGYMTAEELSRTLEGYAQGQGTIDELRQRLASAPDDLALVYELGERSAIRGDEETALTHLQRIIEADADNALGLRIQAHLVLGKYFYLRGAHDYARALEHLGTIVSLWPDTEEAVDAHIQMVIAHIRRGDGAAALAEADAFLSRHPAEVDMFNAVAWTFYQEQFGLARGIEIARRGLAVDAASHALWDTLAELQFATGDSAGAQESTRQAIVLAPEEAYYPRQLVRFGGAAEGTGM